MIYGVEVIRLRVPVYEILAAIYSTFDPKLASTLSTVGILYHMLLQIYCVPPSVLL